MIEQALNPKPVLLGFTGWGQTGAKAMEASVCEVCDQIAYVWHTARL